MNTHRTFQTYQQFVYWSITVGLSSVFVSLSVFFDYAVSLLVFGLVTLLVFIFCIFGYCAIGCHYQYNLLPWISL